MAGWNCFWRCLVPRSPQANAEYLALFVLAGRVSPRSLHSHKLEQGLSANTLAPYVACSPDVTTQLLQSNKQHNCSSQSS